MIAGNGTLNSISSVGGVARGGLCRVSPQFGVSINEVKKVQEAAQQAALDAFKAEQQEFLLSSQATFNGQQVTGEEILDLVDQKIKSVGFLRRYSKAEIIMDSMFTVISGGLVLLMSDIRKSFRDNFKPSLPYDELSALLDTFKPLPETRYSHIGYDLRDKLTSLNFLESHYSRYFLTPTGHTVLKARQKRLSQ